jgi:cell division septation protein DedD
VSDPGKEGQDSYLEIQMDRETVVLALVGVVVLLVIAFLVGRWTAGPAEDAAERSEPPAAAAPGASEAAASGPPRADVAEVDSKADFGAVPVAPVPPPRTVVPPAPTLPATTPPPAARPATPAPRAAPPAARPAPTPARDGSRAPSPPPAPATAKEGAAYVIQVLAATEAKDAAALVKRLQGRGYAVRTVEEDGYHKVQVGPFATIAEAQVVERRLKREEKLATWIRRS